MLNMAGSRFDVLYDKGDPASLEMVKDIIRSEASKGRNKSNKSKPAKISHSTPLKRA